MNELTTLWTMVLLTLNPAAVPPAESLSYRAFGHFVTESLCYEAVDFIDRTSFFAPETSGAWILTCDPPERVRSYE